jgi:hypothetical protein
MKYSYVLFPGADSPIPKEVKSFIKVSHLSRDGTGCQRFGGDDMFAP